MFLSFVSKYLLHSFLGIVLSPTFIICSPFNLSRKKYEEGVNFSLHSSNVAFIGQFLFPSSISNTISVINQVAKSKFRI